jgi:hypothetical protein
LRGKKNGNTVNKYDLSKQKLVKEDLIEVQEPQIITKSNQDSIQDRTQQSITISEIKNQALQLQQYEEELKNHLDNL